MFKKQLRNRICSTNRLQVYLFFLMNLMNQLDITDYFSPYFSLLWPLLLKIYSVFKRVNKQ